MKNFRLVLMAIGISIVSILSYHLVTYSDSRIIRAESLALRKDRGEYLQNVFTAGENAEIASLVLLQSGFVEVEHMKSSQGNTVRRFIYRLSQRQIFPETQGSLSYLWSPFYKPHEIIINIDSDNKGNIANVSVEYDYKGI